MGLRRRYFYGTALALGGRQLPLAHRKGGDVVRPRPEVAEGAALVSGQSSPTAASASRERKPTEQQEVAGSPGSPSITSVSWSLASDVSLGEWALHGGRLGSLGRAVGWWIGDWLRYGNARFGERYARAARITRYDVQTLMNMAYVASRFPIDQRREGLSWSHHAAVAQLDEESRRHWLDLADAERMSVRCLRDAVRRASKKGADGDDRNTKGAMTCPECGAALREKGTELVSVPEAEE